MPFTYEDCLSKGLLRRIAPSKTHALRSLKKGEQWLKEARMTLKGKAYNATVLASYLAMFHSARAILFSDGFREKSHACVARYLEAQYVRKGKLESRWIELLDHSRERRHDDQYDLTFVTTSDEAQQSLQTALDFLDRMRLLLQSELPHEE